MQLTQPKAVDAFHQALVFNGDLVGEVLVETGLERDEAWQRREIGLLPCRIGWGGGGIHQGPQDPSKGGYSLGVQLPSAGLYPQFRSPVWVLRFWGPPIKAESQHISTHTHGELSDRQSRQQEGQGNPWPLQRKGASDPVILWGPSRQDGWEGEQQKQWG